MDASSAEITNLLKAITCQDGATGATGRKPKKAFQDFFELWKDADSDILILQQARAEYAGLR